jgi:UDP-glucose 4-epimerase
MCPEPRSPYAVTKLDGEFYCRQFSEAGRLETVSLRFFNVFGPRQNPSGAYGAAVPVFFQKALSEKPLKAGFYPTGTLDSGLSEMLAAIR